MTTTSVLLVDDDATFRRAMAKALGRKGFVVTEIAGGGAAIDALLEQECPHDVVVLDLQMPEVSGMEVLRRTALRRPKVVVLTGHGTIPDAVEAMRLGAFSFLLKPIDADELLPPENSRLLASRIPGAELLWLPGAGHDFPTEDPERTAEILRAFLLSPEASA